MSEGLEFVKTIGLQGLSHEWGWSWPVQFIFRPYRSAGRRTRFFSRPYLVLSRLCYRLASVVYRLWRYVLWLNGAS